MATGQSTAFGVLLRQYRIRTGLTQEQLAEQAGLSTRAITALERGVNRAPQRETFRLLADALMLAPEERAALEAAARSPRTSARAAPLAAGQSSLATHAPFVGRAQEMEMVRRHLEGDGPSLMLIHGEPGIGKSRLLREATLLASARGMTILEGGCHWNTCQEPYAPVVTALEQYLAYDSPAHRRSSLRGCAWLTRLLPELVEIIGMPVASWPLMPEQERHLSFSAVARFLANIRGPGGILLVIDDFQWIGPDVRDLLLHLMRSASGIGLRIIAAYRDTEVRLPLPLATAIIDLVRDGEATRIDLKPLADSEAKDLLARLLEGGPDQDESTRSLVLARAEGVPFYLVSCAQALRAGVLVGQGSLEEVPWDIGESVRQRLAMLLEAAQDLVSVAAVVGQEASGKLLAQVSGRDTHEALAALDAACRARLLTQDKTGIYRFTHDVIWEVVVADMGTTRRQMLHRRIAEALEQDNSEQWLEALVYHYMHSDDRAKALPYLDRAASRAMAQRAHATAEIFYWQQAALSRELGRELDAARAHENLGVLLRIVARHDEALEVLEHAARTYRAAGDVESLARVTALSGWVHARRGTPREGLASLQALLPTLSPGTLSPRGTADLYVALGELQFVSCHYVEQLRSVERVADYAREAGDKTLLARALMRRGIALHCLGRSEESRLMLREAIGLAEETHDGWTLCRAMNRLGIHYRTLGRLDDAHHWTERARDLAEQQGDPTAVSFMWYDLGETARYRGEWQQARAAFERAAALIRELPSSWISTYALLGLGQLNLAEGHWDEARRDLEEAIARSEAMNELQVLRHAQGALAERDILRGDPQMGVARLEQLLDREGQQEIHVTMLLPVLAWAYQALGDTTRAADIAASSIERARAQTCLLVLPDALRVAAIVQIGQRRWQEARQLLDESTRLAREMSCTYAVAKALFVTGQLHADTGELEQAGTYYQEALAICERLGERLYAIPIAHALRACGGAAAIRPRLP